MSCYAAGLRINEACHLQVADVDSKRMVLHVRHAKGGRERFAPTALASFQPPAGLPDAVNAERRLPDEGKLLRLDSLTEKWDAAAPRATEGPTAAAHRFGP